MGLNLSVSCGSDAVEIRLTNAETEGIKTLQPTMSADVETVFGVVDFGKRREVSGEAFAHAVRNLLKVVEAGSENEGRIYYLEDRRGKHFLWDGLHDQWRTILTSRRP